MISVSNSVRTTITSILANFDSGFNATLEQICIGYSIIPFTLDYTPKSKNVFNGWYGIKDIQLTTNMKFPVQTIYTMKSQNTNDTKFLTFSGSVMIGIDTYYSFPQSAALNDTESILDAIEATYYNIFNSESTMPALAAGGLIYNGDLLVNRAPLTKNADNWLTLLQSRLTVDYEAQ